MKGTKMSLELKPLNWAFIQHNYTEMYNLLDANRTRLLPWFDWAGKEITPNKSRFYIFLSLYMLQTKHKKFMHKINSSKLYDVQFIMYMDEKIVGMCGLDNIDAKKSGGAELWFLTFDGTPYGTVDYAIQQIENYSVNTAGLNNLYAHVRPGNTKSYKCLNDRNNYTTDGNQYTRLIGNFPKKYGPVYVFKKLLTKGADNVR